MIARPASTLLTLGQVLHGYADGHRRLAGSRLLSRESEQLMVLLSDLSGPGMTHGFEEYLTGYPLPGDNVYALARTWYAREMTRPGCVWTHTLLLENADLARLADLSVLLTLFSRPRGRDDRLIDYRDPLSLELDARPHAPWTRDGGVEVDLARGVLVALYGRAVPSVLLEAKSSAQHEALVLAIWSQQWPRLRRSFRFCTGALSDRSVGDQVFDLQSVPLSRFLEVARAVRHRAAPASPVRADPTLRPRWVEEALADLRLQSRTQLREFLWFFAADVPPDRRMFGALAEIHSSLLQAVLGDGTVLGLVDLLAAHFPRPKEAARLKALLFGGGERPDIRVPRPAEEDILRALCTTQHYSAFEHEDYAIRERAATLWRESRSAAESLLLGLQGGAHSPPTEQFLAGVAEALTPSDVARLAGQAPQVLRVLVRFALTPARSPVLWSALAPAERRTLLGELAARPLSASDMGTIVAALHEGKIEELASDAVALLGEGAVAATLDWADERNSDPRTVLSGAWRRTLASHPAAVLRWLGEHPHAHTATVALVASLLNPHAAEVRRAGASVWRGAERLDRGDLDTGMLVETLAFLLTLGLATRSSESDSLIASSFQTVHDAAERNSLSHRAWDMLDPVVPSRRWWWHLNDDRPERLRQALLERAIERGWSAQQFLGCVRRPDVLRQAIKESYDVHGGKQLRQKLAAYGRDDQPSERGFSSREVKALLKGVL